MSIIKGTNQIVAGFGGTKRPLGEVYFSQSSLATDNPGALPGWTGEYYENGKTLFPDLYNFVKADSTRHVTKAQYDNAIATYAECPKYVVDENTAQTSLRLPKYQTNGRHLVKKEVNGNDWYALYSDGWLEQGGISTSQTVTFLKVFANINYTLTTACEYGSGDANNNIHLEYANNGKTTTGFSWAISIGQYVKSINWEAKGYAVDTPIENIQYPWISAYTSAIPTSVAQAAEFQQGLSGKADTNLGNLSTAGKNLASGLGMPSNRYIDLTVASSSSSYTAPANGYFVVRVPFTDNQACALFNTTTLVGINLNSNGAWTAYGNIPVKKNDVVRLLYNCTPNLFRFVYAEGDK